MPGFSHYGAWRRMKRGIGVPRNTFSIDSSIICCPPSELRVIFDDCPTCFSDGEVKKEEKD